MENNETWEHSAGEETNDSPRLARVPDIRLAPRKTERNKICSCGSGKKSKKCCYPLVVNYCYSRMGKLTKNVGKKNY